MSTKTTTPIGTALALAACAALLGGCQKVKELVGELQPLAGPQHADSQPQSNPPAGTQPSTTQPSTTQPSGTQPSGTQPSGGQPYSPPMIGTVVQPKLGPIVVAQPGLAAPTQISPVDGAVFSIYPRTTMLQWSPVSGAATYGVEVQFCQNGTTFCAGAASYKLITGIKATSVTFDFVGAQPGIWRVWAVDASGNEGWKTAWWKFVYTK
ncbi:MAG TPA: hypothetical protein VEM13_02005 [Gemmatimonadales bacterium]|nr:hypothetical protein [Gemmatimonadales bacterium]